MMEPVPAAEITVRVEALQKALAPAGIGLALIRQPADLFYYAGTLVDGFLAVAPGGQPSLLVRRPHHRDQPAPGPWPRVLYRDLKELPRILGQAGLGAPGRRGAGAGCHSRRACSGASRSSSFPDTPSSTSRP